MIQGLGLSVPRKSFVCEERTSNQKTKQSKGHWCSYSTVRNACPLWQSGRKDPCPNTRFLIQVRAPHLSLALGIVLVLA
jgi:hypothetical protein